MKTVVNQETVEKVVSTVTGTNTASMVGTWTYTGSAVEFESDNFLQQAGGTVAASTVEGQLDKQLSKLGITSGKMTFTFASDSTFTAQLGSRNMNGTYSYDASTEKVTLSFSTLLNFSAKVSCTSSTMDLLFNADKLLKVATTLASKSSNSTLKSISSLAGSYDGMLMGFSFTKKE